MRNWLQPKPRLQSSRSKMNICDMSYLQQRQVIRRLILELRHLHHLIAIADEGSFTKAARRLNIVQSGISASIKELESELGSKLLERTTRKVAFTDTGSLFLQHARATLAALDTGVGAVHSQDGIVRGRLNIGILQSLSPYVDLPLVFKRFQKAYPEVEVSVRTLSTENIPEMVRAGEIHLSFHALLDRTKWPGVEVIPYKQDALFAVVASDHSLAYRRGLSLEVLAKENFVDLSPDRALRKLIDYEFKSRNIDRRTAFEVSDIETAVQFVAGGLGIAILPSIAVQTYAVPGSTLLLKITDRGPRVAPWRLGILRRPANSAARHKGTVDLFLDTLASI